MKKYILLLFILISFDCLAQRPLTHSGNPLRIAGNISLTESISIPGNILVTSINVAGASNATTITVNDGTLQMYANVSPNNANDTTITWSRINGTGTASISAGGLLTAITDGTVTVRATANDGSSVYGEEVITISNQIGSLQLVADHTAVDNFDNIPAYYISEVKKMLVWFAGESHSYAYRDGMDLLEALNSTYDCNQSWGFESYTTSHVRLVAWPFEGTGEAVWYTWKAYPSSPPSESEVMKDYIDTQVSASNPINFLAFGWCWDMVAENGPTTNADPTLGVHWYGASVGGPDGSIPWGIDAEDYDETSNRVSLQTYFDATEDYITYCAANSPSTTVAFTTGPVDHYAATGEGGYQVYLKHEAIRDYVETNGKILFDYADILCYDDGASTPNTTTWNGHTYPIITTTNGVSEETGHITEEGAIRLAKAQWWLLARIAGWDGVIE